MKLSQTLPLLPEYRNYIWGGTRLREDEQTAEAWIVYEGNRIASGIHAGCTLSELTIEFGAQLLGESVFKRTGTRFPILIKLLDCAQWLSLQVHPNDEQAIQLEGQGQMGKTEAWQILDAEKGAKIIAGFKPDTSRQIMDQAIQDGTILDHVQYQSVKTGDTIFMRAGTLHALGPGLLVYEIQQTSDITYRVFDWNRPQAGGRVLHISKSLAVTDPNSTGQVSPMPEIPSDSAKTLTECEYFKLEMVTASNHAIEMDTAGVSFQALTVIEGAACIVVGEEKQILNRYETVLIPAVCGKYKIEPLGKLRLLKASTD